MGKNRDREIKISDATISAQEPVLETAKAEAAQSSSAAIGDVQTPVETVDSAVAESGVMVSSTESAAGEAASTDQLAAVAEEKQIATTGKGYSRELQDMLAKIERCNDVVRNTISTVEQYVVEMAPTKTMPASTGVYHQAALFNAIHALVEYAGPDFKYGWATLLKFFHEFKDGALAQQYVYRFAPETVMVPEKQKAFEAILTVLVRTADPKSRELVSRHVDMNKATRYIFSAEGRKNLLAFYKL